MRKECTLDSKFSNANVTGTRTGYRNLYGVAGSWGSTDNSYLEVQHNKYNVQVSTSRLPVPQRTITMQPKISLVPFFLVWSLFPTLVCSFPLRPLSLQSSPLFSASKSISSDTTVQKAKDSLMELLRRGEVDDSPKLTPYLDILKESYLQSGLDARSSDQPSYNGDWRNVNLPEFAGRLGLDESTKLPLYTIGSLTFNLIPSAKDIVCVVDKMVQRVHFHTERLPDTVPDHLQETVTAHPSTLRTNQIDTVFSIPDSSIQGILRMEGYTIPNSETPNKYDTWFVGGRCFCTNDNPQGWNNIFGNLDTEDDDQLQYTLPKSPTAFQTVIYLDDDMRISVGNRGSVMIVQRDQ